MEQSQKLAEVISLHRKAAKLSRIKLAELAGVGKTVVYDIEKGKESVQLDTLRKILKVLNITIVLTSPLLENLTSQGNEKG
ncbi:MAG TPA: helix-turn-helix domain-containing protein [Bacteroidales bacterium]|jgi:transcriptional regulator with XRE-family HTH domain|nr:helix-turn-helix domain-containing protein [Bacteroidota bacterium]HPR73600.1 helix-turn-helix domain-containing protein [Bacteroidales bacterium]